MVKRLFEDLLAAFQFLTRLPVGPKKFCADSGARAVKFFPVVGLAIGLVGSLFSHLLVPHLNRILSALAVLTFFVLATNALHEDGLADAVDGLGGGWSREQALSIMRDSRIGSFGAIAIALSLLARLFLLSSLPLPRFTAYVVSAHVLCRWTALPLSFFLPSARAGEGQGAQIARRVSTSGLVAGTGIGFGLVALLLGAESWVPIAIASAITLVSGWYCWRRLGGMTGDCFGAANQLAEIAVYFCGVWNT
ncbi:MAG: adenosylcobinamide-GDP ribazoletransferase [Acidobacteria bacterium]|nr:adenosylcobinamide-GDP ribazoletransferase [Acidobacteriota bacterium]